MAGATTPAVGEDVTHLMGTPGGEMNFAIVNGKRVPLAEKAADLLPAVGGTIGGFAGGIPGAILGGAAGEGYQQLAEHATELPGAVADVIRGLVSHPIETLQGFNAGAGEGLTEAAKQAGIQGGAEALGGLVAKGATSTAKAVYRGYLKPSLSAKMLPKAQQIVESALSEGIPVAKAGVETANRVISDLRGQVDRILANAPGRIDLVDIADQVRAFARRKYFKPGADLTDYKAALAVADRIDRHPSLGLPSGASPTRVEVSLSDANQVKRALQDSAAGSYGQPNASAVGRAEKVGGRELRLGLENQTGGAAGSVAQLNARESKLIDVAKTVARAVEREANQNPLVGMKTVLAAGAGTGYGVHTGDPATAAGMALALRVGLQPAIASRAAIVAFRLSRELGIGAASAARLAVAALRDQPDQQQQEPDQSK